jgi:ComF family protein
LDFIYPPVCLICREVIREENPQNPRVAVCSDCWNALEVEEKPYCSECKLDLQFGQAHNCPAYLDRVYSLGMFDENFQEMIHHFKYKNKISLGKKLGQGLAEKLKEYNLVNYNHIIPVPLHKARKRERGFNQSEILAETLAKELNLLLQKEILFRIRNTKDQTKLSEEERKRNVAGAFEVRDTGRILAGKKVILVDDVITTGATLNECAKVLKQAGVKEILAVTIAKAS